jgi:hypothetical protein
VEELRRFFRLLVQQLITAQPGRLSTPLSLGEIRHSLLPYRAHRRALQLESSEEYELVLVRLCAGEGSLARIEPGDIQAAFAAEALSANPDLTIIDRYENAAVVLNPQEVTRATGPAVELAYAPPEQRRASESQQRERLPTQDRQIDPTGENLQKAPAICRGCGGKLPQGPIAKFCPHCGERQMLRHCPECQSEIEPAWRHCIACGATLK